MQRLLLVALLFASQVGYAAQEGQSSEQKKGNMTNRAIWTASGGGAVCFGAIMIADAVDQFAMTNYDVIESCCSGRSGASVIGLCGTYLVTGGTIALHLVYTESDRSQKIVVNPSRGVYHRVKLKQA